MITVLGKDHLRVGGEDVDRKVILNTFRKQVQRI
jgi:hypothetical protein